MDKDTHIHTDRKNLSNVILTPIKPTQKQKDEYQVDWILTPTHTNNNKSLKQEPENVIDILESGNYAYIPHNDLDSEQLEELELKEKNLRQMKAQRIDIKGKRVHDTKHTIIDLGSLNKESGGSCVKYAVYSPSTLSSRFKQLVDENNPVVIVSPVRRSKRHGSSQIHPSALPTKSPKPILLDSLSELDQKIDYAWLPNTAIKEGQNPFQ